MTSIQTQKASLDLFVLCENVGWQQSFQFQLLTFPCCKSLSFVVARISKQSSACQHDAFVDISLSFRVVLYLFDGELRASPTDDGSLRGKANRTVNEYRRCSPTISGENVTISADTYTLHRKAPIELSRLHRGLLRSKTITSGIWWLKRGNCIGASERQSWCSLLI